MYGAGRLQPQADITYDARIMGSSCGYGLESQLGLDNPNPKQGILEVRGCATKSEVVLYDCDDFTRKFYLDYLGSFTALTLVDSIRDQS